MGVHSQAVQALFRGTKPNNLTKKAIRKFLIKHSKIILNFTFMSPKTKTRFIGTFRSFRTACRKAGMPDSRFHDLRHIAVALMVMGGIDLVTVSQILGHSTIQMTMQYAHPIPENKRRAVNVLASIFEPEKEEKSIIIRSQEQKDETVTYLLSGGKNL